MSLRLEQTLKQNLTLNQNLITSLNILTLPTYDLEEFIEKESENNPFLKVSLPYENRESNKVTKRGQELSDIHESALNNYANSGETLFMVLDKQLRLMSLDDDEKKIAYLIITSLDEKGLLNNSKDELLKNVKIENKSKIFDKMQEMIKCFTPLGVASDNVWDALKVQLEEKYNNGEITNEEYSTALKFLSLDTFELLNESDKNDSSFSKKAKKSREIIETLKPYPSYGYKTNEDTIYIMPELFFKQNDDKTISVSTNNEALPSLVLDDEYLKMLDETKDASTKKYLKENYNSAVNLINTLNERNATLLLIGNALLQKQYDFFKKGKDYIKPLTLEDVSKEINRDKSTISRIVNSKYMDTPFGVFPIKILFSRSIASLKNKDGNNESEISREAAKTVLKKLIDENADKKLSDEKLRLLLKNEGIDISRRTVNKYKLELKQTT